MNATGFIKYKIFRISKPLITENVFCNLLRTRRQKLLIKKIKQTGVDISSLNLNWDYISLHDKLKINFIDYFKAYINFDKLSQNKNLKIKHIRKFKDYLNWDILSQTYKFELKDLKAFHSYVNWQYIFFYQNYTKKDISTHFRNRMWWLFPNDKQTSIQEDYTSVMEKIIHNNMRDIPLELADIFDDKLKEYISNKRKLKNVLKQEIFEIFNTYDMDNNIPEIKQINIEIVDELRFVEQKTQTEYNFEDIKIEMGPDEFDYKDEESEDDLLERLVELEECNDEHKNPFDETTDDLEKRLDDILKNPFEDDE